jgi:hypothetical protein
MTTRKSTRIRHEPPRSPDANRILESHVFKDSPKKLAFALAYSNAVATGEIGRGKRTSKKKTAELADKYGVRRPRKYYHDLMKKVDRDGRVNRKKRTDDKMILERNTPEAAAMRQALEQFAVDEKFHFTYRMAEEHMRKKKFLRGCSKDSINRFINNPDNGWKQVYEGTVPLLTTKHQKARLQYAKDRLEEGKDRWVDHFDVDEKWFYGYCHGQKCKVAPGHNRPKKPLQSKRHIPKVMFLAATALPRPDKGFDGKIGFWRVSEWKTAERASKYHKRGEKYRKDVPMDADQYLKMMKTVFRAARRKMPWAKNLRCQQDGAAAHTGKNNVKRLNIAGTRRSKRSKGNITVFTQSAQSPDQNINDLVVFPSMSKGFNKLQKHEVISDLDRLAANARKAWNGLPAAVLTKGWATKTKVLHCIKKAKGKNDYKLPHTRDMEINWEAMYEDEE